MRSIKIFFATLLLSVISLACEPEKLPADQPQMDDEIINIEKSASGDEDNPIDDDRKGD
tara:strand:- start:1855 stop:2031 length:177 start_codon:yes stop_codon:yes gene_type:complete